MIPISCTQHNIDQFAMLTIKNGLRALK